MILSIKNGLSFGRGYSFFLDLRKRQNITYPSDSFLLHFLNLTELNTENFFFFNNLIALCKEWIKIKMTIKIKTTTDNQ